MQAHSAIRAVVPDVPVPPQPADRSPLPLDTVIAEVERRRDEFDRLSHVPRDVIAMMKRAGIFRAGTPAVV